MKPNGTMEDALSEGFDILEISRTDQGFILQPVEKQVITEISLKILINNDEYASLLCLNQCQEDLAVGFLYSEGVIDSYNDIASISYNERLIAVIIQLRDNISIRRQESLRSVTSGCGRCFTYINPLKQDKYKIVESKRTYPIRKVLDIMGSFMSQSELYRDIGGVHSVLYHSDDFSVLNEDIGRHNCVDKITGILMKDDKLVRTREGIMFISGRISSEIMTKVIRLQIPIMVSRSTPTAAAVKLAEKYHVTLLGYVRGDSGYVYTCPERLTT